MPFLDSFGDELVKLADEMTSRVHGSYARMKKLQEDRAAQGLPPLKGKEYLAQLNKFHDEIKAKQEARPIEKKRMDWANERMMKERAAELKKQREATPGFASMSGQQRAALDNRLEETIKRQQQAKGWRHYMTTPKPPPMVAAKPIEMPPDRVMTPWGTKTKTIEEGQAMAKAFPAGYKPPKQQVASVPKPHPQPPQVPRP